LLRRTSRSSDGTANLGNHADVPTPCVEENENRQRRHTRNERNAIMQRTAATMEPDQASGDLSALDDIAARLLARVAPIRYAVASTERQRLDAFLLRYRAVMDRGWAPPEELPDGLERDADDERAVLIGAWDGAIPVATARLIFPDPAHPLPVESAFDVTVEPVGRVVSVDRITVDRSSRDAGSRLLLGLFASCWLEIRKRGYHIWAGTQSAGATRLYHRLGFEVTVLGPPRVYWGEERFPVRFDPISGIPDRQKLLRRGA
jgi:hypothetical protein